MSHFFLLVSLHKSYLDISLSRFCLLFQSHFPLITAASFVASFAARLPCAANKEYITHLTYYSHLVTITVNSRFGTGLRATEFRWA